MDDAGRSEDHPTYRHGLSKTKVNSDSTNDADIAMRRAAGRWHKQTLEVKHRADYVTDSTGTAAGEAADLNAGLGAGRSRHQHCGRHRRKTSRTQSHNNLPSCLDEPLF